MSLTPLGPSAKDGRPTTVVPHHTDDLGTGLLRIAQFSEGGLQRLRVIAGQIAGDMDGGLVGLLIDGRG